MTADQVPFCLETSRPHLLGFCIMIIVSLWNANLSSSTLIYTKEGRVENTSSLNFTFFFNFSSNPKGKWILIRNHSHQISHVHLLPFPHFGHDWSLLSMEDIQNDFNDMSSSTFTVKLLEEVHVMIYCCTQYNFIVGRTYKNNRSVW